MRAAGELFVGSEEYGWVALNFVQGRLVVEKTQREKVPEPIGTEVTNVVAKSDGIIRRLELVDGYPRVVPGQYVAQGQVLVSGMTLSQYERPLYSHAQAEVLAEVEKSYVYTQPLHVEPVLPQAVSKSYYKLYLPWGELSLYAQLDVPENASQRVLRRPAAPFGFHLPALVEETQVRQAVSLAAQSLAQLGKPWVLEVSHMGYLFGLFDALGVPENARPGLLEKLREKNAHELRRAAQAAGLDAAGADALTGLLELSGSCEETLTKAESACRNDRMRAAAAELRTLAKTLEASGGAVRLDLSLAGEMEYYNGLVFQGYLQGLPRPLLKGGRYDLLMQKFTPGAGAIGFAVYLDELDRLSAPTPPVQRNSAGRVMLNVALPKGRLGDRMYDLLARIGYGCTEDYNATRKLVVENPAAGIRYFLVKPSDVAIYVEHGAADVGIVGKDILTEASADVYELLDTGLGKCRMCVAAPADYQDDPSRPVRVATKFVNVAKSYYASMGRDIDIIKLNGSIELAPILGLSDVIVDIVETGTTLRENGLKVVTEFMPISARFIANKASYQFKHNEMDAMLEALRKTLQEETK